jgi:hydroxymethylbilane synthase
MKTVRIGTRGSQLALYQAYKVRDELQDVYKHIDFQLEIIKTKGDKILDQALSKIGDKGLFTKEIEEALVKGEIDLAVHSLKDLPTELPEGLKLGAVLQRAEFRDALVSLKLKNWSQLNASHVVATSSVRRKAQILNLIPGISVIDIRGNVNTRLKKLEENYCDATIMAAAGLQRLGLDKYIAEVLPHDLFIPAVSQGIIGVEIRESDLETQKLIEKINHQESWIAGLAERKFLAILEGGCQLPVACYTNLKGVDFEMFGMVADVDGKQFIKNSIRGRIEDAEKLAGDLAKRLLQDGAAEILAGIRL